MTVKHCSMSSLVPHMRISAATGTYDGLNTPWARAYLAKCTWHLIFSRDTGIHTSGWWKNPDYERCFHLSMSFFVFDFGKADYGDAPQDHGAARKWCEAIFGTNDCRKLWIEPPFFDVGKAKDVYHYRLFCDEEWQAIKPRGEVYSKRWTPADWRSWSDIHGATDGDIGKLDERTP